MQLYGRYGWAKTVCSLLAPAGHCLFPSVYKHTLASRNFTCHEIKCVPRIQRDTSVFAVCLQTNTIRTKKKHFLPNLNAAMLLFVRSLRVAFFPFAARSSSTNRAKLLVEKTLKNWPPSRIVSTRISSSISWLLVKRSSEMFPLFGALCERSEEGRVYSLFAGNLASTNLHFWGCCSLKK